MARRTLEFCHYNFKLQSLFSIISTRIIETLTLKQSICKKEKLKNKTILKRFYFIIVFWLKSHLRGQVKPKKGPRIQDQYYDWVEEEYREKTLKEASQEMNKNQEQA